MSSMVGGSSARWGMWGTSLDIAKHIQTGSAPNSIRVSNGVQRLNEGSNIHAGNICQILHLPNGGPNLTLSYLTQNYKPLRWLIRFEYSPRNMQVGCSNPSREQTKLLKQVVISRLPKRSATDMNATGRGHHNTDTPCHVRCGKLRTAQCP